ncbi:MAG: murein L,D-transpeptidase catalytic domain family protein [Ferruginibacter sp.]
MFKLITYSVLLLTALLTMSHSRPSTPNNTNTFNSSVPLPYISWMDAYTTKPHPALAKAKNNCYNLWQLGNAGLSEAAFKYAMKGFEYLKKTNCISKKNIVSIIDFSQPSTHKRLYVIDMTSGKILFNTWVAHGRNSGNEYANQFSNSPESHQSSLGFYTTMDTYIGANGYSLRLKGCEKGINDKAYERAIVIHGADYVSDGFINNRGVLGRSYGCPALPAELNKKIIDLIKNGSCIFLYHPTKKYCSKSKILNSRV